MKTSICIATRNKEAALGRTLESIRRQQVPFKYEIIVADDGSSDLTRAVCKRWDVDKYTYLDQKDYRNPSVARNTAYRQATGEVIIAQSDEVLHYSLNTVQQLTNVLTVGWFAFATVYDFNVATETVGATYTGQSRRRHLFFLGSLFRRDLFAVGGNDEEFVDPAFEDDWFADCLINGLGLHSLFIDEIGYHQSHDRINQSGAGITRSRELYEKKVAAAKESGVWQASGGPWEYVA